MIMFNDVRIENELTCFFLPEYIAEYFAMCMEKSGIKCIYGDESKVLVRTKSYYFEVGRRIERTSVPAPFDMNEFLKQEGDGENSFAIPKKHKFRWHEIRQSKYEFINAGYDDAKRNDGDKIGVIISNANIEDLFKKALELLVEPIDSEFKVYLEQQEQELIKKEIELTRKCEEQKNRVRMDIEKGIFMNKVQELDEDMRDYFDITSRVALYSTDIDMMQKLLNNNAIELSTFESKEIAQSYIEKIILEKIDAIIEWVSCPNIRESTVVIFNKYDYPVGKGYIKEKRSQTIKEYTTNKISLWLGLNAENEYGFSVLKAYPEMCDEDIETTGCSLQSIVEQTPIYKSANPSRQVYMKYQVDLEHKNKYLVTYEDGDWQAPNNMLLVHIPTNHPNVKHIIRIEEFGEINLYTVNFGGFYDDMYYDTYYDSDREIESKYDRKVVELDLDWDYKNGLVDLRNSELHDMFYKSYPDAMNYVDWLYHSVQEKITTCR